jgi:hypothetical protein
MSVPKFIQQVDEFVYKDYLTERFMEEGKGKPKPDPVLTIRKPAYITDTALNELKKISQLPHDHKAKQYIVGRSIPNEMHHRLFYAPKFMAWVNGFMPGKFDAKALRNDQDALVIPFLNAEKRMHALQGRFFSGGLRYVTIVTDESVPKLWGLDRYDRGHKGYVLEGPIDAMFLPNAVATAGGVEISTLKYLNLDNVVICFDNEPRAKETIKKIEKCIKHGLKVCIWPEGLHQKDVNDMVIKGGLSANHVREIIDMNTFSGLRAELQLNKWKRV